MRRSWEPTVYYYCCCPREKLLAEFIEFSEDLNLAALVETHDEAEVEIALTLSKMIGINQRDLKTFKVDQKRAFVLSVKYLST